MTEKEFSVGYCPRCEQASPEISTTGLMEGVHAYACGNVGCPQGYWYEYRREFYRVSDRLEASAAGDSVITEVPWMAKAEQ